jgi:hypothetical protein
VIQGATEVRLVRVDEAAECTHPGPWRLRIGGWATVAGSGLHSCLVDLAGLVVADTVVGKDTNPLGPVSEVPVLFSAGDVEVGRIYAAAVHLGGSPLEALPELDITASAVDVRWPDGRVDRVAMPPV